MEAEGDGYLGRTLLIFLPGNLGFSHRSFSRRCLHHHFPVGISGASWTKWAQSRISNPKHPKNSSNLKTPRANQSHPIAAWRE